MGLDCFLRCIVTNLHEPFHKGRGIFQCPGHARYDLRAAKLGSLRPLSVPWSGAQNFHRRFHQRDLGVADLPLVRVYLRAASHQPVCLPHGPGSAVCVQSGDFSLSSREEVREDRFSLLCRCLLDPVPSLVLLQPTSAQHVCLHLCQPCFCVLAQGAIRGSLLNSRVRCHRLPIRVGCAGCSNLRLARSVEEIFKSLCRHQGSCNSCHQRNLVTGPDDRVRFSLMEEVAMA
mmetsp:Transcript_3185/g.10724  ORF Transcript_3185/g.10724 Transcript_3185/m.10724 type:complete len:231 (+) Transcript_3185:150-842(+)